MLSYTRLFSGLIVMGLICGFLSGCQKAGNSEYGSLEIPESFSISGIGSRPEKWWETFGDETLNGLVAQAIEKNHDVLTAWDRLAQGQAISERTNASLWPSADLSVGAERSRLETPSATTYGSEYYLALAASYEVDLWRRLKSKSQAAILDAESRRSAVDTTAITISATVADTWYQLAEAKSLDNIILNQIDTNKKVLTIVTTQFRKGKTSAADVLRQRQLVAATEAKKLAAEETVRLLQNRLSILIGRMPSSAWQEDVIEFPKLTALPDPGIPMELLRRRPDVRSAFLSMQAADERLTAAIANQYPRVSISGSVQSSSTTVHDLFDNWLANLAGNLIQPLFDAGARKADVKYQKAVLSETVHKWEQMTLNALNEVEDALFKEQQQHLTLKNLIYRLKLAQETFHRNNQKYIKGQIDYIRVLESLQSLQNLEISVANAKRAVIQRRIALYRSIAGQWDLPEAGLKTDSDSNAVNGKK